jgi:helicase
MIPNIESIVLERNNFKEFNIVQKKSLDKLNKNLIVSSPTASGKTIIAELFMLERVLKERKKVIYTCPLRALASEHYNDFKKKYPEIKFALSTGDLDSSSSYLKKFDVIFTTFEKLCSLLRHKTEWLTRVNCLIIDEFHELDSDRGPVLEIAITQLRNSNKNLKILGLSATISNSKQLAEWLQADLIESDFRPVKLREGIICDNIIEYKDGFVEEKSFDNIFNDYLKEKKQALFFLNSRKNAENQAKKMCDKTTKFINNEEKSKLENISKQVLNTLEQPTEQCYLLSECIKQGCSFHHAGLMPKQKNIVEDFFRKGLIKVICATTTLSAGINTPADLVFIPTLYRYTIRGMEPISKREYFQMAGRSGRPKFSSEGKSIINANNESQKDFYFEKFFNGELEPVLSKLGSEQTLRTHVLALISTKDIFDDKSIWHFFEKTLFVKQSNSITSIYEKVLNIIDELKEMGFVEKNSISCTSLGKRVSDLFLDPKSAFFLIQFLKSKKDFSPISYFFAWSNCQEFQPLFQVPKKLNNIILEDFCYRSKELPFEKNFFLENQLNVFYSSLLLEKWVNEENEQDLFKNFGLSPGVLFGKTRILDWLAYSTIELSKIIGDERHLIEPKKLSKRLKYGVKEELLNLVELKNIGRVRARRLFNAGIKNQSDVKKNILKIEMILGKTIAESLKKQLKLL